MKSLNLCQFIGRLGQDVDLRTMPNGTQVAGFSLAVQNDYVKDGNKIEQVEWVRCAAFGKLAEICGQYLTKGSQCYLSGQFRTRSWEQDGVKKYTTEIVASQMQMLDSSGSGGASSPQSSPSKGSPATGNPSFDDFDSDLPF